VSEDFHPGGVEFRAGRGARTVKRFSINSNNKERGSRPGLARFSTDLWSRTYRRTRTV